MPYKIRKSGGGYKVTSPERSYSKEPMSKEKARRQLAAIKINTNEEVIRAKYLPIDAQIDFENWQGRSPEWMEQHGKVKFFQNGGRLSLIYTAGSGRRTVFDWDRDSNTWTNDMALQMAEGYLMEGKTCPSCEEGNHHRCRDEWCDCCGGSPSRSPRMSEVFQIREAPIQNRPPPGSRPVKDVEWNALGNMGQALHKGLDAMKSAGQEMTAYDTPQGDRVAFPKDAAPGRGPMKADDTKGVWTPMTGSSAQGTPFASQAPTTTMK